jgi:hypothetical protein
LAAAGYDRTRRIICSIISGGMSDPPKLHFGGPDRPPRHLRDLLKARIVAVPPGGEISWATYYFRDRDLAEALLAASDRGVRVNLHVEGHPRRASVNQAVLARLRGHGLGGGLHVHAPSSFLPSKLHPHLHSKIYIFSHPDPAAFVGSFNPSGDVPEDPEVIAAIGDQDRGHNLLVEFSDPDLVAGLHDHVQGLGRIASRFRPDQNSALKSGATTAWFFPRLRPDIIDRHLASLGPGSRVSGAISHLKEGLLTRDLARSVRAGASVRLIVHDTERRVPEAAVTALAEAGIQIARYRHPQALPLHSKFLLIDEPGIARTAYFGSFNYNPRSRYLNRELLVRSREPVIVEGLAARFDEIAGEIEAR